MSNVQDKEWKDIEGLLNNYVKKDIENSEKINKLESALEWYVKNAEATEKSLSFRIAKKISRVIAGTGIKKIVNVMRDKEDIRQETPEKDKQECDSETPQSYSEMLSLPELEFYKYKESREQYYHISPDSIDTPCVKGLVSIVLPVYNGEEYLEKSIESVLRQTYENFEFIIVNDGSTDHTKEIVDKYALIDNRIRVIHKQNEKLPKTLSRGFSEARGEFFTWTSADNIMEKNFIEKLVTELQTYPETGMVFSNISLIDENDNYIVTNEWYANKKRPEIVMFPHCILRLNTYADNYIGAAFMYRACVAHTLEDYSIYKYCTEDYDYWMRINDLYCLRHTNFDDPIYRYRFHSNSLTSKDKELKISENRYQLMFLDGFRRDYFLKPLEWIIDGDYNSSKIFEEFVAALERAGHKLVHAENWDGIEGISLYERRVYIKFEGESKLKTIPKFSFKALVLKHPDMEATTAYDCYISEANVNSQNFLNGHRGWFSFKSGEAFFAFIDAKAKNKFLYSMEKHMINPPQYTRKLSVILPYIEEDKNFIYTVKSLLEQDVSPEDYELVLVGLDENKAVLQNMVSAINRENRNIVFCGSIENNIVAFCNSGLWAAQGKFINIIDTSYIYEENYVRKILGGFYLQPDISIAYAVEKSKEGEGKLANSIIFKAEEILLTGGFLRTSLKGFFGWSGWENSVVNKLKQHRRKTAKFEHLCLTKKEDIFDKQTIKDVYEKFMDDYKLQLMQLKPFDMWPETIDALIDSKRKEQREDENYTEIEALELLKNSLKEDFEIRLNNEKVKARYTLHPFKLLNKKDFLQKRETDTPWVSIIIPVYKVENYLDRCLESVIKQSLKNIEIILVDDGSPDACPEICDQYALADKRIKVIHKENGGLSDARNAGIDKAQGRYIAFLDSDDWVDETIYEELCFAAEYYKADIAECSFRNIYTDYTKEEMYNTGCYVVATNLEALESEMKWGYFKCVAWNKIYRRELFNGELRYPKGRYHEDEFLTHKLIFLSHRLVYLDRVLYNYDRRRNDSITGSQFNTKSLDAVDAWWEKAMYYKKNNLETLYEMALELYTWIALDRLKMCEEHQIQEKRVDEIRENLFKNYPVLVLGSVPQEYLSQISSMRRNDML